MKADAREATLRPEQGLAGRCTRLLLPGRLRPVLLVCLRHGGGEARALRRTLRPLPPTTFNAPLPMPMPDTPLKPQVNSRLGSLKHETVGSHAALLARVEKLEEELLRAKAKS